MYMKKRKSSFYWKNVIPENHMRGEEGLEQYKLLSSGSESKKMKEDNALNFYKTHNSNSIIVEI